MSLADYYVRYGTPVFETKTRQRITAPSLRHLSPTRLSDDDIEAEDEKPSRASSPTRHVAAPRKIPNGGAFAWLQCANSFFLFFNAWGLVNAFGVFQTYYQRQLLSSESASNIAWIGSIQGFFLLLGGLAYGPLFDAGYLRPMVVGGTLTAVFGMMMTSICQRYWQLVLAQGVVTGLGAGALFLPSVAILPMYFTTRKSLAQGISASGAGIGGIVYAVILQKLIPRIGFGWTVRLIAFLMLVTLLPCLFTIQKPVNPPAPRRLWDTSAWRSLPYSLFVLAMGLSFMALYIPLFYVQDFALQRGIVDDNLGFYLLAIINAGSIFGRIIPNYIADQIGPLNVLVPAAILVAILPLAWIAINSTAGILIFCILYGFFSGTIQALQPVVIFTTAPSPSVLGVRLGMLLFFLAIGFLIGTPIGGVLLKSGWLGLQVFCGSVLIVSAALLFAARMAKTGWTLRAVA